MVAQFPLLDIRKSAVPLQLPPTKTDPKTSVCYGSNKPSNTEISLANSKVAAASIRMSPVMGQSGVSSDVGSSTSSVARKHGTAEESDEESFYADDSGCLPREDVFDDHIDSAEIIDGNTHNHNILQSELHWSCDELRAELKPLANIYNGPGPCLRCGVASKINTLIDACAVCGGMDYQFFKRLAANSNQYARANLNAKGYIGGTVWARNISTEEMYRYHGILLKMSLDHRKIGGYRSYFAPPAKLIVSANYAIDLVDYPAWAAKHMALE